ncbi:MAG: DMT family transporter [Candidatus Manganitrophaceae bacterium]
MDNRNEHLGWFYGFLGIIGFSLTLPATRIAVAYLDPVVVGLGRGSVAGLFAAAALWGTNQKWPPRKELGRLLVVAGGVVLGFPLLSSWAMRQVPASHGAIVMAILPLATAVAAALRAGERPAPGFWVASGIGGAMVVIFSTYEGLGRPQVADLALLGAVAAAALGYAEGGFLARRIGGWQVISWALVLEAPVMTVPLIFALLRHGLTAPPLGWLSFSYLCAVSQFVAFFPWYKGLAIGGIARVGQIQLLQPFLTILFSSLLLGETITSATAGAALLVVGVVALERKMSVRQTPPGEHPLSKV